MSAIHQPVLVLNKAWAPIHVQPVYKAVSRCCEGAMNVVDHETYMSYSWHDWMELEVLGDHSFIRLAREPFKIRLPRVVVANNYSLVPRFGIKLNSQNLWARDGGVCQYTGKKLRRSEADMDHVVPRSKGGSNTWENVVLCDKKINAAKADKSLEQAGLELIREPKKPQWTPEFKLANVPKEWTPFLGKDKGN